MRKNIFIIIIITILLIGCRRRDVFANRTEESTQTSLLSSSTTITDTSLVTTTTVNRTHQNTKILITPSLTASGTSTVTIPPTTKIVVTPTATPTIQQVSQLTTKCIEISPELSSTMISNGKVVMESREIVNGHYKPDAFLLDMVTHQTIEIVGNEEGKGNFTISPDRKLMAYENYTLNPDGTKAQKELTIDTVEGQRLKAIPWEKKWMELLGWTDNQHLVISYDEPVLSSNGEQKIPISFLVLNPFNDERQILRPDYPQFIDASSAILPYWGGWYGLSYDPTLTRAIYPRFVADNGEMYTYGIWDLSKQKLVASLENIFAAFTVNHDQFPIPRWSPDGSQFVFRGLVFVSDQLVEFELYRVSRDGQPEQLTHLTSVALIQDSNLSWSPDGKYIAMFLNDWGVYETKARVALLNTSTHEVTDYCLSVNYAGDGYGGEFPPSTIWSPDGTQFLVVDWFEKDHRSVILVDIVKKFATKIAEDMEPVGWMANP